MQDWCNGNARPGHAARKLLAERSGRTESDFELDEVQRVVSDARRLTEDELSALHIASEEERDLMERGMPRIDPHEEAERRRFAREMLLHGEGQVDVVAPLLDEDVIAFRTIALSAVSALNTVRSQQAVLDLRSWEDNDKILDSRYPILLQRQMQMFLTQGIQQIRAALALECSGAAEVERREAAAVEEAVADWEEALQERCGVERAIDEIADALNIRIGELDGSRTGTRTVADALQGALGWVLAGSFDVITSAVPFEPRAQAL